tara:strand:- start:7926 stop:8885 length:960 start_codon:yes stop_codon:yes gene_type:complete
MEPQALSSIVHTETEHPLLQPEEQGVRSAHRVSDAKGTPQYYKHAHAFQATALGTGKIKPKTISQVANNMSDWFAAYPDDYRVTPINQGLALLVNDSKGNAYYNTVFNVTAEDIRTLKKDFFQRHSFFICNTQALTEQDAKDLGLTLYDQEPEMCLDLTTFAPKKLPHESSIKEINTQEDFEQWLSVFREGFIPPKNSDLEADIRPLLAHGTHPQATQGPHFYLLYDQEVPAACGLMVLGECTVGIYHVATHPDHRRKGLATRLMTTMLTRAKEAGYQEASLIAGSRASQKLYENMGFNETVKYTVYHSPKVYPVAFSA